MAATLGEILLVFLADRFGTPYELQQRHGQTFGPQEAVDVTRVMQALARQERLGNVRLAPVRSGKQRVYALTEAGRRRQRAWIVDVPGNAGGADLVARVLLAMTATDRETFDAVVAACLAVVAAQRRDVSGLPAVRVMSPLRARAKFDDAVSTSLVVWLHDLAAQPRERDAAA
ncbi:PadR family transcriptional regulator [Actinoplanes sp. L3-i22]|uniref:PadR family transcriptional regulator n=1 Tax=Actinoplanes sp. L3-i22 TaxID=2836373 RepID=UPI001C74D3A7|nr:PadR family transcriptional regulator [Actinoplanes sp. L3-i22]BCY11529.1 hypothetical protein L3i22_066170 [Actinoplanes sp. L3-i22]